MTRTSLGILSAAVALFFGFLPASPAAACGDEVGQPEVPITAKAPREPARIEIAILLDVSGSMDGLIDQARARLWAIVNTMALSRKGGVAPDLRVALYEYGNAGLPAEGNYIREVVPLTTDLDKISQELFAFKTNGGDEYCGAVIRKAVESLKWSEGDHYKAIFIAGNEPFTQGPVPYADACRLAISKGIIVNTIHCGPADAGRNTMWEDGARLADGSAVHIDQDAQTVAIPTPFDDALAKLSERVNGTYIAFGSEGKERAECQAAQDANAASVAPGAGAQRAVSKATGAYRNASWDLVDACDEKAVDIEKVAEADLPEEMRKMTLEERKAFVAKKGEERKKIQEEILKASGERDRFIAEKRKETAASAVDTFDTAVQGLLAKQLEKKGFAVEQKQ